MQNETFEFDQSLLSVNMWEYDQADPFLKLISAKNDWYINNFGLFWSNWFYSVFQLQIDYDPNNVTHVTSNLFGCIVWAIILDFPITPLVVPRTGQKQPWAFENIGASTPAAVARQNFANYASGGTDPYAPNHPGGNFTPANNALALSMLEKVQLLKLAYYRNIGNCSIPFLNNMLADVFTITGQIHQNSSGQPAPVTQTPYVVDNLNMTITYTFPYTLSSQMQTALLQWDALPHPSGVSINVVYLAP